MRRLVATLLALAALCAPAFCADTETVVNNLRARAAKLASEKKYADASPLLRDAALLARQDKLDGLEARCLFELCVLHGSFEKGNADAVPKLREQALLKAVVAGDYELELELLRRKALFTFDGAVRPIVLQAVDCALVAGKPQVIEELTFLLFDDEQVAMHAVEVMDLLAEADLLLGAGRGAGVNKLVEALELAEERGYARLGATLRRRIVARMGANANPDTLEEARKFYARRGDLPALAACAILRADLLGNPLIRPTAKAVAAAREELEQAVLHAARLRDYFLQANLLEALARIARDRATQCLDQALAARATAWRRLLARAEAAVGDPDTDVQKLCNELRRALTQGASDDNRRRANALIAALEGAPAASPEEAKTKFVEAFKKALAKKGWTANYAVTMAEVTGRREVIPALVDEVLANKEVPGFAQAVETIAIQDDVPYLLKLLKSKDAFVLECAAAGLFRVTSRKDMAEVCKALEATNDLTPTIFMAGLQARHGDTEALARLRKLTESPNDTIALHGCTVLAALGFNKPLERFSKIAAGQTNPVVTSRALGRTPHTFGPTLVYDLKARDPYAGARAMRRRNQPGRLDNLAAEKHGNALIWLLPTTPREAREAGLGGVCGFGTVQGSNNEPGKYVAWLAQSSGLDIPEWRDRLKDREDPLVALALTDLETRELGVIGGPQSLTLSDLDDNGRAVCLITVWPRMGDLGDNVLKAPFVMRHKVKATGGGIAGIIYRELIVQMEAASILDGATVNIPGQAPIKAGLSTGPEGTIVFSAELPYEVGEGLGDRKTLDLDKIANGSVTINFKFAGSQGRLTFPLALVVPPRKDKPDLVAEEIMIEPPVPGKDEEATVTLRARNMGKAILEGKICNCRFTVKNPQAEGGYRTLGAVIFNASGWRPGEWREFRARPKFVKDYFMNRYSTTWTLELGDTEITAHIDADGALEEADEENNRTSVRVPLYLAEAEGKKLAVDELLAQLKPLLKRVEEAKTAGDAFACIGAMRGILENAKVMTPEIEITRRHIEAAVELRVFNLRTEESLKRIEQAKAEGKLTRAVLGAIAGDLAKAQQDLLKSGAPVATDTLNYVRNRVMTAANATKALDQWYGDFGELMGGPGGPTEINPLAETLGKIDSVLLLARYARDYAEKGEADSADVLEAAGGLIPAKYAPGLSKLHQAMLDAEIKYVDKGFRKNADALNAISDLMDGKEGAQQRLDAAVRDVQTHLEAGPFNKDSLKEIVKGWVKDLPVLGPVLDTIWSWKKEG